MTDAPPFDHWQVRKIQHRYRKAIARGWHSPPLGTLDALIEAPVWIYSIWSPLDVDLIGSSSSDCVLLVDNTFVSSFAFTLAKIELAAQLLPDEEDYAELLVGNLKKFFAEQSWFHRRDAQSAQWIIEYLYEFNGRNRRLDQRLQAHPVGKPWMDAAAGVATFSLLLHEVGHIAYRQESLRSSAMPQIAASVAEVVGPQHGMERLEEEAFCDIFAMVNATMTLNRDEGWEAEGLLGLSLHCLLGGMFCVLTRDVVVRDQGEGPINIDPESNILMARAQIAANAMKRTFEAEKGLFAGPARPLTFKGDTLDLRARWQEALDMPVLDDENRNLSKILARAVCDPYAEGFDYVMQRLNQFSPVHDLSQILEPARHDGPRPPRGSDNATRQPPPDGL